MQTIFLGTHQHNLVILYLQYIVPTDPIYTAIFSHKEALAMYEMSFSQIASHKEVENNAERFC